MSAARIAPMPKIVPTERVLSVVAGGRHGTAGVRSFVRFSVYVGDAFLREFEHKREAEAYIAGWEDHRTRTLDLVRAALGVAP